MGINFCTGAKAWHLEPGAVLAQVAHYIHLNPLAAGIVAADELLSFRHSSLYWFAARKRPAWLNPSTVLHESGELTDSAEGWRCYCQYLATLAEEDPRQRKERFAELTRGWVIGSAAFALEMQERLMAQQPSQRDFILLGADRAGQLQVRQTSWEETLRKLAQKAQIDMNALPARKSATKKMLFATALKKITSVSNRWLAERLQLGNTSSVAALIRRFRLMEGMETPCFKAAVAHFEKST